MSDTHAPTPASATGAPPDAYLFDNRAPAAEQRFAALSALFNPGTFRHVEALGIQPGWRCWEVGAGGPSVPGWLADRVGSGGHVVATDIDTGWIGDQTPNVEVRRHDVAHDDPPADGFDLVHARLVLIHLPDRDEALRRMARALRPGGWLLIEDFDPGLQPAACIEPYLPEHHLANRLYDGLRALLAQRGFDLAYARKLPRLFAEQGLVDVAADAYFPVALPAASALNIANIEQVRDALLAQGLATEQEINAHLAAIDGGLRLAIAPLISAWGRRPLQA
jgi:SAM-dependent methyltransferase